MKSLAELAAIRDKMKNKVVLREGAGDTRVVVGMATCGIAAGARPVLGAFVEAVSEAGLGDNVIVVTTHKNFDDLTDIALYTVIFAIIGARAYYVLTSLDKYDSFLDMIAIWEGGLAIYGGVIFGALTVLIVAKVKKMSNKTLLKITDSVVPGVMIAQANLWRDCPTS